MLYFRYYYIIINIKGVWYICGYTLHSMCFYENRHAYEVNSIKDMDII